MNASRLSQLLLVATALSVSAEERQYTAKSAAPELLTDTYTSTFPQGAAPPPADRAPYPDYRADDPPGAFDVERAAAFIDNAAVKWGRKHGCVTCHTNGHYLIAPAEVFRDRPAAREVRDFVEDWIGSWDEVGLPDVEVVVAPAAFLAINNMQMQGELRPATLRALGEAWRQQSSEGHWPNWVKCNWPPFETDDHYGVTLMLVAMGMAPPSYTGVEPARSGIRRLKDWLAHHRAEEVHHRAMLLWAGSLHDGLITDDERQAWMAELLSLQKRSGGWAAGDLGRWRQRAPESGGIDHLDRALVEREYPKVKVAPDGDGYGTGIVMYALLRAGLAPSHPAMRRGLEWLRRNQQADGKWFTNSLRNEVTTSNFLTHTGTTFALKVLAEPGWSAARVEGAKTPAHRGRPFQLP